MIEFIRSEIPTLFPLDAYPGKLRVMNEPLEEYLRRLLGALPDGTKWKLEYVPTPELAAQLAGESAFAVRDDAGRIRTAFKKPFAARIDLIDERLFRRRLIQNFVPDAVGTADDSGHAFQIRQNQNFHKNLLALDDCL